MSNLITSLVPTLPALVTATGEKEPKAFLFCTIGRGTEQLTGTP